MYRWVWQTISRRSTSSARAASRSVSASDNASGISQRTCLPARKHRSVCPAWSGDGEQTITASTSGSASSSSSDVAATGIPNSRPNAAVGSSFGPMTP
jgi:hypothetical protein